MPLGWFKQASNRGCPGAQDCCGGNSSEEGEGDDSPLELQSVNNLTCSGPHSLVDAPDRIPGVLRELLRWVAQPRLATGSDSLSLKGGQREQGGRRLLLLLREGGEESERLGCPGRSVRLAGWTSIYRAQLPR